MELRHLRYFIAVAEAGSLTVAAEKKLHTAQPSLSRQIQDLEYEVGVQLMSCSVHGIELTAAGRAFLDMHGWPLRRQRGEPRNLPVELPPDGLVHAAAHPPAKRGRLCVRRGLGLWYPRGN